MKILVNIVILLFLTFLAAPTIVSLLQDDEEGISMVYGLDEEEMHKEIKQCKVGPHWVYEPAFIPVIKKSTFINTENLRKHESVFGDIFIPPPEVC